MIDEVLRKLIDFLQEVSPLIWSTFIKQVYVEAFANIAWAIGLAVVCVLFAKLGNYGRNCCEENYRWEVGAWFAYIGSTISGFISFGLLVSAIMHLANPEFYAIRYIISQIAR